MTDLLARLARGELAKLRRVEEGLALVVRHIARCILAAALSSAPVTLRARAFGLTDVGMQRMHNEDAFTIVESERALLAAVFDGCGGLSSGSVAADIAAGTLEDSFREMRARPHEALAEAWWRGEHGTGEARVMAWSALPEEERANVRAHVARLLEARVASTLGDVAVLERRASAWLAGTIEESNRRIVARTTGDRTLRGMGTTIAAALVMDDRVAVAHVGDSRVYGLRRGALEQLTEDHSLINEYLKMNRLSPEEIENFPHKNVITRALGMTDSVVVDTRMHDAEPGDTLLLCTDGLLTPFCDDALPATLRESLEGRSPQAACEELMKRAIPESHDNLTAVVIAIE
jgi:serine/threonine protein phosphatase PrpC